MNREWIGIATDLTENGVSGAPYQAPAAAAAYPRAPAHGRLKTIAVAGALLAAFALWLPPRHSDAPATPEAATEVAAAPVAAPVAGHVAAPAPAARRAPSRKPAPLAHAQREDAGEAAPPAPTADAETATEINLDHYRSLTRGL